MSRFTYSFIDRGRVTSLEATANTTGEARADFKRQLGLRGCHRLPVGARLLITRKADAAPKPEDEAEPRPTPKRRTVPHVAIGHRCVSVVGAAAKHCKRQEAGRKAALADRRQAKQARSEAIAEKRRQPRVERPVVEKPWPGPEPTAHQRMSLQRNYRRKFKGAKK